MTKSKSKDQERGLGVGGRMNRERTSLQGKKDRYSAAVAEAERTEEDSPAEGSPVEDTPVEDTLVEGTLAEDTRPSHTPLEDNLEEEELQQEAAAPLTPRHFVCKC